MSTDRELLELAAKAAGIDVGSEEFADPIDRKFADGLGLWVRTGCKDIGRWFNPLNDDGEALRLAVRLGLAVSVCLGMPSGDFTVILGANVKVEHNGDPCNATRRAIVLAAADIGKEIP